MANLYSEKLKEIEFDIQTNKTYLRQLEGLRDHAKKHGNIEKLKRMNAKISRQRKKVEMLEALPEKIEAQADLKRKDCPIC